MGNWGFFVYRNSCVGLIISEYFLLHNEWAVIGVSSGVDNRLPLTLFWSLYHPECWWLFHTPIRSCPDSMMRFL